jgi:polyhydroxyalkanoate synthesis regulator phasin
MAGRADESPRGARDFAGDLLYAGVGAVALTKDRVDELVDALTQQGRMSQAEARETVEEMMGRWRGEASRIGSGLTGVLKELGLVTRSEWEDLELRLAQVEHRLRLVEGEPPGKTLHD